MPTPPALPSEASLSTPARLLRRALHTFFDLLYTRLAWTYDLVAWLSSMGQWSSWQSTALESLPEGPVLELGHGPGHILLELARRPGAAVVGIDASPQMSRLAARRIRRHRSQAQMARASVFALPFRSGSFSAVVSTFPTEYIQDRRTVAEVARVLRPAGSMVMVPFAEITGPGWPDRWAGWLNRATAQAPAHADRWWSPWRAGPFEVIVERLDLPRSRVWRMRARRLASPTLPPPAAGSTMNRSPR